MKQPKKKTQPTSSGFFRRINNIVLFLFLLFLPTQLGKHFFLFFSYLSGVRVDYLAPTIYLTDFLALLLVALNLKTVLSFFRNKKFLFFLILVLIGGFFASSKELFLYWFFKYLELFAVFAIIKKAKLRSEFLLFPLLIGTAFEFILATLQFINKQSLQGVFYLFGERYLTLSLPGIAKASLQGIEFLRPYGTFSHPNSMAGFYLLLYVFFLTSPGVRNKSLRLLFLFLCLCLIMLSFSKVALLTLLVVQLLYLSKDLRDRSCIPCLVARVSLFIVLVGIFSFAKTDPLSLQKRLLLVQNALTIISAHPLFGVGLGNYLLAQETLKPSLVSFPYQPVHNIFLLFLAEVGLIPAIYLLSISRRFFAMIEGSQTVFLCAIVILVTGFFDHYWLTLQQNILLLGTVFGVLTERKD